MARERHRNLFTGRSLAWVVAVGATLGIAAVWALGGSDLEQPRRTAATLLEIPELLVNPLPELSRPALDLGTWVEADPLPARERKRIPLARKPAVGLALPSGKTAAPALSPLPPIDPKPDVPVARRREEPSLGPESLISPDIGETKVLVTATAEQLIALLSEPARPAPKTEREPSRPVLATPVREPVDRPPVGEPSEPKPQPKSPVISVSEPRPVAIAPPGLEHLDSGKPLFAQLPKLPPVEALQTLQELQDYLTLQPSDVVSNHPPPESLPWWDAPNPVVVSEPTPAAFELLEVLREPFGKKISKFRDRVIGGISLNAVPEPGTAVLLAAGLTLLAWQRRR